TGYVMRICPDDLVSRTVTQRRPTPEERLQYTMPAKAVRVPIYRHKPRYPLPPAPRQFTPATIKAAAAYPPLARPAPPPAQHAVRPRKPQSRSKWWLFVPLIGLALMMIATCSAVTLGAALIYGQGILPGVSAAGVDLGGLSEDEAAQQLASQWNQIIVQDGERTWAFAPAELGISLDAAA